MTVNKKITLVRSAIGKLDTQKKVVKALGIRKLNQSVIKQDTVQVRGMIAKIKHLVTVEDINGEK